MTTRVLFDAHLHLPLPMHIIKQAQDCGIRRLSVCATNENWDDVLRLAAAHPGLVIPSIGIHPWWAAKVSEGWQDRLRAKLLLHPECELGEIGLDKLKAKRADSEHHVRDCITITLHA